MPESNPDPLDLDSLLQRLQAVAAEHVGAAMNAHVAPRPWLGAGISGLDADAPGPAALPWALASRAGGLAPYLVADDAGFVALAYQRLFGRAPDPGGLDHLLDSLRRHVPRTELLLGLALSAEAKSMHSGLSQPWRFMAQAALWAVHSPLLRGPWLVRGVWRRSERWVSARLRRGSLGLAWQVAMTQQSDNASLKARLERAQHAATAQQQQQQAEIHAHVAALRAESASALQRQSAALQSRLQAQERRLELLATDFAAQTAPVAAAQGGAGEVTWVNANTGNDQPAGTSAQAIAAPNAPVWCQPGAVTPAPHSSAGTASGAAVDDFLAALEASFRGSAEALRTQLAQDYLGQLQELRTALGVNGPCLDLGCGRGVWLDLLRAEGFAGLGVDLNGAAVHEARAQGLKAEQQDALAWLQAQPDSTALLVTAFHLMEHVPFSLRLALLSECERVLRPGGMVILETPNPENIWVATHTFHHDPTHSQPLTPDSLTFLVNYCGLEVVAVPRLHPYPAEAALTGNDPVALRLNHMTCSGQDFAVLARKP